MEPHRLQSQLKSVYDVLPTPTNLATWGMTDDPKCKLCGRPANLEHILSSCSVSLTDGRYTWRHDKVLSVLADTLERARTKQGRRRRGGRGGSCPPPLSKVGGGTSGFVPPPPTFGQSKCSYITICSYFTVKNTIFSKFSWLASLANLYKSIFSKFC